jgi:apolipoprotein N-acyltransferase
MNLALAAVAAACLCLAGPPAFAPWLAPLVFVGWACWYALIETSRRPYWVLWCVGFVHIATFSWSLRHVTWAGTVAIAALGSVYTLLPVALVRRLPHLAAPAFAIGVAIAHWWRAHMPEISYPHGQPIHALYESPSAMASVGYGGEFLGNLLVGLVAAGIVDLWRCWRVRRPGPRVAWTPLCVALGIAGICAVLRATSATAMPPEREPAMLDVLLVEPGFGPNFGLPVDASQTFADYERSVVPLLEARLRRPSVALAGRAVVDPPDVVVWPENAWFRMRVDEVGAPPRFLDDPAWVAVHPKSTVLTGVALYSGADGREDRLGTALLGSDGRVIGYQEKERTVAMAESLPLANLLPTSWTRLFSDWMRANMGAAPTILPGRRRPPLRLPNGALISAMVCFDNAFPSVSRAQVDAGARALIVVSNESWYHGGMELEQMVAMSVCRALETRTPVVRCTVDGATVWVDRDGVIRDRLPEVPRPRDEARTLRISVPLGQGRLPPMAWLRGWLPFVAIAAVAFALARRPRNVG